VENSLVTISLTGSSPTESGPGGNSIKKIVSGWVKYLFSSEKYDFFENYFQGIPFCRHVLNEVKIISLIFIFGIDRDAASSGKNSMYAVIFEVRADKRSQFSQRHL